MMSSLPSLSFDERAPFTMESFLEHCKGNITDSDYDDLCSLTLAGNDACTFTRKWKEFYGKFINTLTSQRCRKHSVSVESVMDEDFAISNCVSHAIAMSYGETGTREPLEAELFMLRFLFQNADNMIGLAQFDQTALFGYAVKLLLLLRKDEFSVLEGKAEYKRLFCNMQSIIFDTKNKLE